MAWYSGNPYERFMIVEPDDRALRGRSYWALIFCNILMPQLLWFKRVRSTPLGLCFIVAIVVNVGMWLERFVIVVTSLHRDFLPSSWGMYYADDLGLGDLHRDASASSCRCFFLFIRFLPMISIFEMRTLVPEAEAVKETEP